MNIALGFDKNFVVHAATTICSILENNKNVEINFYLLIDKSVNFFSKFLLKCLIHSYGKNLEFIDLSCSFNNLFTGSWSKAMYYPILLSGICPDEKILFLDSDTLVTGDLSELYNVDLSDYYCAAVQDYGMLSWIKSKHNIKLSILEKEMPIDCYFSEIRKWDMSDMKRYFNSGMLLLNLEKMRADDCEEKMINILKSEPLACPDQDCFNICFHDKVNIISPKYNFMVVSEEILANIEDSAFIQIKDYLEKSELPLIIHHLAKPWCPNGENVLYGELYWKYRNKTIWRFNLDQKTLGFCKKKIIRLKISSKEYYLVIAGKKII